MIEDLKSNLSWMETKIKAIHASEKVGSVVRVTGLIIESEGPEVSIGQVCEIVSPDRLKIIKAQVVAFEGNRVLLMRLSGDSEIHPGSKTVAKGGGTDFPVGEGLIGRVIDGMGRPIDGKGPLRVEHKKGLDRDPPNPMERRVIRKPFQTGIKSIDTFTPLGEGQRVGIFASSGVGKSVLLGMVARGSQADVNVIALVGERGRELKEFIDNDLGIEGMDRSIVVVATSDQPAPMRIRAALLATSIAEYFRDQEKAVLFLMDSVTRFAMAQREIGLAVGEPPATRGYTPSVFSVLPRLLERTGMGPQNSGFITAIYTVLVEGDDMDEPVADAVRGFLDGHIVLSRALANANHFPAVDVLDSISRLDRIVTSSEERGTTSLARNLLALYRDNEDLINVGAYVNNTNPEIDKAIEKHSLLKEFLKQDFDKLYDREKSVKMLQDLL